MPTIWRGVRARGWRAVLAIALLTLSLAANTVVFSAADAFVFNRVPYANASRLVEIAARNPQTGAVGSPFATAAVLDQWQAHSDVFATVQGYLVKNVFVTATETARVPIADVTPGLFDLLGVRPRWGRGFAAADAAQTSPVPAIVSEAFARRRFGAPAQAINQLVTTSSRPLLVVGVMPAQFAFPDAATPIWRVMDPHGPLTAGFAGTFTIARLADGIPFERARELVQARASAVGAAAGTRQPYAATLTPLRMATAPQTQRQLLLVVLGTAICLLLTACANVASLELTAAVTRARTYAIRLALGEDRSRLIGSALGEGLVIVGIATAAATALARAGTTALAAYLPDHLQASSGNPMHVDARALVFMAAAALLTWAAASLPVVFFAARANVADLLRLGGGGATAPAARLRRAMTIAEVAAAVVLLAGTLLYTRTYMALAAVDNGWNPRGLAEIDVSLPGRLYPTLPAKRDFADRALERLTSARIVASGIWGSPPPDAGTVMQSHPQADGKPAGTEMALVGDLQVVPSYFSTLRIPITRGRSFTTADDDMAAIVGEDLARQLWPGADPIGRRFRIDTYMPWRHVVGVVPRVRNSFDPPGAIRSSMFQMYSPLPRAVSMPQGVDMFANDASYGVISLTVRVDNAARLADAARLVRSLEPRGEVHVSMIEDEYKEAFADRLVAAQVVGGFGLLAFLLAGAGVYGVMAFLVASRGREIGIRMALGADAPAIRRLVLRSALSLLAVGLAAGAAVALAAGRFVQSQLFGVRPFDPLTWVAVLCAVGAIAALATWRPAHAATRVDPSALLRE